MRAFFRVALPLVFAVAACGPSLVAERVQVLGASDLQCPREEVSAYRGQGGLWIAKGCGRWTDYQCGATSSMEPMCIREGTGGSGRVAR